MGKTIMRWCFVIVVIYVYIKVVMEYNIYLPENGIALHAKNLVQKRMYVFVLKILI
jgi:hypothetical protein